ncbi:MAG: glycerophosphodiester phosphodiesterase family protein, partial [Gemmatimonadota bacterium]
MPEIVGHRGYAARAPENTLVSLDMAIEAGADAVEWDVQVAACGTPVLLHDDTLDRTTDGRGPVAAAPLARLRDLDAGRWFGADFEGERIPSLAETLEHVRGRLARAFCEVKSFREPGDVDRVVEIVRTAGMLGEVVFISLEWEIVERVASLEPAARIGFILDEPSETNDAL